MRNAIIAVENVHAYLDAEGIAWLDAEDVTRGFGFTAVAQSGNVVVRWARVNEYLAEFGFSQEVGKEDFIPENTFYRLAMKAKNEVAEKFQAKVADEILPAIRKHGLYATDVTIEKMIANLDFAIQLFQALKAERAEKQELRNIVDMQAVTIAELNSVTRACSNYCNR